MKTKQKIRFRKKVDRERHILKLFRSSTRCLHLGCSDAPITEDRLIAGNLLHEKLLKVSRETLTGFDISETHLDLLKDRFPDCRFILGNAEQLKLVFPTEKFDLIIAGEILEHVSNMGNFIDSCRDVLADGGIILLTIPNAFGSRRMIHTLLGVENYHFDHVSYLSENTIAALAKRSGLSISNCFYYPSETEGSLAKKLIYLLVETIPSVVFGNHLLEGLVIELKK